MAIDTRSKRASAVQVIAPWQLAPVLPDGTIGQLDRQHCVWVYSGILATVVVVVPIALTLNPRSESLTLSARSETLTLNSRSETLTLESEVE